MACHVSILMRATLRQLWPANGELRSLVKWILIIYAEFILIDRVTGAGLHILFVTTLCVVYLMIPTIESFTNQFEAQIRQLDLQVAELNSNVTVLADVCLAGSVVDHVGNVALYPGVHFGKMLALAGKDLPTAIGRLSDNEIHALAMDTRSTTYDELVEDGLDVNRGVIESGVMGEQIHPFARLLRIDDMDADRRVKLMIANGLNMRHKLGNGISPLALIGLAVRDREIQLLASASEHANDAITRIRQIEQLASTRAGSG